MKIEKMGKFIVEICVQNGFDNFGSFIGFEIFFILYQFVCFFFNVGDDFCILILCEFGLVIGFLVEMLLIEGVIVEKSRLGCEDV